MYFDKKDMLTVTGAGGEKWKKTMKKYYGKDMDCAFLAETESVQDTSAKQIKK